MLGHKRILPQNRVIIIIENTKVKMLSNIVELNFSYRNITVTSGPARPQSVAGTLFILHMSKREDIVVDTNRKCIGH